jgi:hypothetical protein
MREHADDLPEELDLGIPLRRDLFDKLLETNKEEQWRSN